MTITLSEGLDNVMDMDEERNNGFLVEFEPIDLPSSRRIRT